MSFFRKTMTEQSIADKARREYFQRVADEVRSKFEARPQAAMDAVSSSALRPDEAGTTDSTNE